MYWQRPSEVVTQIEKMPPVATQREGRNALKHWGTTNHFWSLIVDNKHSTQRINLLTNSDSPENPSSLFKSPKAPSSHPLSNFTSEDKTAQKSDLEISFNQPEYNVRGKLGKVIDLTKPVCTEGITLGSVADWTGLEVCTSKRSAKITAQWERMYKLLYGVKKEVVE